MNLKQELKSISDERIWARNLRKRYRTVLSRNPALADEYDVADANELFSEYLFPMEPSIHVSLLVRALGFFTLIAVGTIASMLLAGFILHIFPAATGTTQGILALGSIVAVSIPTAVVYDANREKFHYAIVKRRAKRLRKWLAKTAI